MQLLEILLERERSRNENTNGLMGRMQAHFHQDVVKKVQREQKESESKNVVCRDKNTSCDKFQAHAFSELCRNAKFWLGVAKSDLASSGRVAQNYDLLIRRGSHLTCDNAIAISDTSQKCLLPNNPALVLPTHSCDDSTRGKYEPMWCLELGCGDGDWVTTHALQANNRQPRLNEVCWIANELRYDRAMNTVHHLAGSGVSNVTVVAGDANSLIDQIHPGTLSLVVSNHPEPPFRLMTKRHADSGGSADIMSSHTREVGGGEHLLTRTFLAKVMHALKEGGLLVVNTDSRHYASLLRDSFVALASEMWGGTADEVTVQTGVADLGKKIGNVREKTGMRADAEGVSYFDRLWTAGAKTRRWHVSITKCTTAKKVTSNTTTSTITTTSTVTATTTNK